MNLDDDTIFVDGDTLFVGNNDSVMTWDETDLQSIAEVIDVEFFLNEVTAIGKRIDYIFGIRKFKGEQ